MHLERTNRPKIAVPIPIEDLFQLVMAKPGEGIICVDTDLPREIGHVIPISAEIEDGCVLLTLLHTACDEVESGDGVPIKNGPTFKVAVVRNQEDATNGQETPENPPMRIVTE